MKKRKIWFLVLLVAVLMGAGYVKKSGLEGKIIDSQGQPLKGLKVIAQQVQPLKGYEYFESKTDSEGTFSFGGLYPSWEYVISVWHKDWYSDVKAQVTAGPEGETILLKEPIQIGTAVNAEGNPIDPQTGKLRFFVSGNNIITDSKTGLEWFVGPDRDTTWDQARAWCDDLSVAGSRWRMPTLAELKTLYIKGLGERNMAPDFKTTGWYVWSGEPYSPDPSWFPTSFLHFGEWRARAHGNAFNNSHNKNRLRAFAVRSR